MAEPIDDTVRDYLEPLGSKRRHERAEESDDESKTDSQDAAAVQQDPSGGHRAFLEL